MSQGDQAWQETFDLLAHQHGRVEVTPLGYRSDDRLQPTFRTRLLSFDEDGFVIERPEHTEATRYLTVGTHVKLMGYHGQDRWECITAVSEAIDYSVTGYGEMLALQLAWPHEVRSAQRRRELRHSVEQIRIEPVVMFPIAPVPRPVARPDNGEDAADEQQAANVSDPPLGLPAQPFEARLLNVGVGGVGVRVGRPAEGVSLHFTRYRLVVTLPSQPESLVVRARVAHRQPEVAGRQYLGLAFEFDDEQQQQQVAEAVARLVDWMQQQEAGENGNPPRRRAKHQPDAKPDPAEEPEDSERT